MEAPTQQVVDGLPQCLSDDIPTGHFNCAYRRRHVQPGIAIIVTRGEHCLPQFFDVKGVGTDDKLFTQVFDQADLGIQFLRISRWPFPQSDDAFIRFQLHKQPHTSPREKGDCSLTQWSLLRRSSSLSSNRFFNASDPTEHQLPTWQHKCGGRSIGSQTRPPQPLYFKHGSPNRRIPATQWSFAISPLPRPPRLESQDHPEQASPLMPLASHPLGQRK